jgi:hypothetical protein
VREERDKVQSFPRVAPNRLLVSAPDDGARPPTSFRPLLFRRKQAEALLFHAGVAVRRGLHLVAVGIILRKILVGHDSMMARDPDRVAFSLVFLTKTFQGSWTRSGDPRSTGCARDGWG